MNNLKTLGVLAIAEGISFLLFAVTVPLKYLMDILMPNMVVGFAHGILFILYCLFVLIVGFQKKWSFKIIALSLIASLVPFGTFVAHKKWFKTDNSPI